MNRFLILSAICVNILVASGQEFNITFSPESIRGLPQWKTQNVSFVITSTDILDTNSPDDEFELVLNTYQNPQYSRTVAEIWGQTNYFFKLTATTTTFSSEFAIKGLFLGYSNVSFTLFRNKTFVQSLDSYSVSVVRIQSIYDIIFSVIIISLVTVNYINMGCHLDLLVVRETMKRPIGPLIGFVCQFTIMPLASYLIGWLILDDVSLRLGLFTLGCSPGGNSSNFWTLLFNGDVNLSVTMTLISTVAALVMMPLWLFTLGGTLFATANIRIPYVNLLSSLITLTFPMVIGIAIRHYRPNWAKVSHKIIKPFTIVVVILAITGSSIIYNHIFLMFTWPIVISGALVAISGYSLGAITAKLCGMDRSQVVAISIETAYQNGSIAFLLLLLTLQQPDADIASVPCIAQLILTGQPLWFVFLGVKLYNYLQDKDKPVEDKVEKGAEEVDKTVAIKVIGLENGGYVEPSDVKTENLKNRVDSDEETKEVTKF